MPPPTWIPKLTLETLRLQVYKYDLPWGLKSMHTSHFGLFGVLGNIPLNLKLMLEPGALFRVAFHPLSKSERYCGLSRGMFENVALQASAVAPAFKVDRVYPKHTLLIGPVPGDPSA